jgi:hypothetical protein
MKGKHFFDVLKNLLIWLLTGNPGFAIFRGLSPHQGHAARGGRNSGRKEKRNIFSFRR